MVDPIHGRLLHVRTPELYMGLRPHDARDVGIGPWFGHPEYRRRPAEDQCDRPVKAGHFVRKWWLKLARQAVFP